jgi:PAS domain S-box-containing protein
MTIATRLKLNILISAAVVLFMSLAFAIGFMVEKRASDRVVFADTLSGGLYDLTVLTEYFLKHPEGRPERQWNVKYDSLSRLLGEAPPELFPEDLDMRMSQSLKDLKVLFRELTSLHEGIPADRTGVTSSGAPSGDPLLKAREKLLGDLITLRLREISGIAERISLESSSTVKETSRSIAALIAMFSSLILIFAIRFSRSMQKAISVPIESLREGTAIVRSGNLDHRIPVISGDELGSLTESFNEMTGYLKASTVSRDELMVEVEERRLAESELHRSQAQLETVIENLAEGLVISDLNGLLIRWNHAALQMHGLSSLEEARRRLPEFSSLFELSALDGTVLPVDQWPLARILRGEHLNDFEIRTRSLRQGWERIFNYGGAIVRDAHGQPMLAIVTLSDITERKAAEEEIRRFNTELEGLVAERTAELQNANRELESFSYSVSHDLRAPLRAIEGFSRILEEDYQESLDEEGKRLLSVIIGSTNNMSKLIDDLLAFSRTGRYELKHNLLDMGDLVRSVLDDVVPAQDREKMTIVIHPLAEAVGDPSLIRQVWANLLSNAVKFSSRRERPFIEVGSSVLGGEVLYSVQDNGTGFDMAYAGKLFGVFQRLHSVKEFEGTGVGLAIAQRIVNRHGGRIWAKAKPDKGATFFFTLPARSS